MDINKYLHEAPTEPQRANFYKWIVNVLKDSQAIGAFVVSQEDCFDTKMDIQIREILSEEIPNITYIDFIHCTWDYFLRCEDSDDRSYSPPWKGDKIRYKLKSGRVDQYLGNSYLICVNDFFDEMAYNEAIEEYNKNLTAYQKEEEKLANSFKKDSMKEFGIDEKVFNYLAKRFKTRESIHKELLEFSIEES